jgi:amidase
MTPDEYASYDAVGLRELLARRDVSAEDIEVAARPALVAANDRVNGLATAPFQPALEHAHDGPLSGVPFLIKDFGPMAEGVPFFCGSRAITGIVADRDSALMTRIRAAGLVTLGLTTAPELGVSFATEPRRTGPTRNPWDLSRGAGGSSGGSAALVAAGAVPIAHGNDGAGSIRVPAACCGLVGLKPTRGRVATDWDGPDPFGLTVQGALTRSLRDTAHFLDAVSPASARSLAGALATDPGRLRVAWTSRAWSGATVDAEVAAAAEQTACVLDELGHEVVEASPEVDWPAVIDVMRAGLVVAAHPFLTAARRPPDDRFEAVTRQILHEARGTTATQLLNACDAQQRVTRAASGFFDHYDLLVTPTLGQLPAPHGTLNCDEPAHTATAWLNQLFEYGPFTAPANITGQPALSLPLAHSHTGLPIGVQLIARHHAEQTLLHAAADLESALPWHHRNARKEYV